MAEKGRWVSETRLQMLEVGYHPTKRYWWLRKINIAKYEFDTVEINVPINFSFWKFRYAWFDSRLKKIHFGQWKFVTLDY